MVKTNSGSSESESAEVAESYNQWLRDTSEICRRLMHLFESPWAVTLTSTSGSAAVRATLGLPPSVRSA